MALANPAIDPPRLPSPTKRGLHSRSPSHSPVRRHHARDTDPLLRDLSPTTTLRAFRNGDQAQGQLGKSLQHASPAQRALGAKAAQACIDLRSWLREVEGWEWPGTFEVPEPVRKKQRMSIMSLGSLPSRPSISRTATQEDEYGEEEYMGSLLAATVQDYERRLDEIGQDLEDMDVEELKDFVLSAHSQASFGGADIDDSIGAVGADTDLRHLDDFTALITATILSALPFLSRLTSLLNTWHIRLDILRATPSYLQDLRQARTDLDHGWAALAVSNHPAAFNAMRESNATFTRDTMMEMREVVSKQVGSLGKRLDRFLDELEGRPEVVPERWIEEFEVLEEQYGSWVVQAERKVMEEEWAAAREAVEEPPEEEFDEQQIDDRPDTARTITVGPTITTSTVAGSGVHTNMNTSTHTTTSGPTTTSVTTVIPHGKSNDEPRGRDPSPIRNRPRHIPIVIDAYNSNPDQPTPIAELPSTAAVATTTRSISPLPRSNTVKSQDSNSSMNVQKRAAFLNGEIEKGDGLIKSKSPPIVRPFEHASNAFTRLFKQKDGSKEDEEGAFGEIVRRKSSSNLKGKRSSSSLKGILGRDKKEEKRESATSSRTSRMSGASSSGSKKRAGSAGRLSSERMEYGDMVRSSSVPKSEESRSRGISFGSGSKKKSPGKAKGKNALEYGDLVKMPDFDPNEIENRSRSTRGKELESKGSSRTIKAMEYGDLVPMPETQQKENRPPTSQRRDAERARANQTLEYGDLFVPDPNIRSVSIGGGSGAAKNQPDYLSAAPQPAEIKRSSRQNITALPQLHTPAVANAQETYRSTGLYSPFHSPIEPEAQGSDFPEDWPLSNVTTPRATPSPTKDAEPYSSAVRADVGQQRDLPDETDVGAERALGADAFDRQFVHTIPAKPVKRPVSRDHGPDEMEVLFKDDAYTGSGAVVPPMDSDEEEDGAIIWTSKPDRDRSFMKTGVSNTSRVLDWQEAQPPARSSSRKQQESNPRTSVPRPVSMVEEAEEEDSSSAGESDEDFGIKRYSDNAAGYFGGARAGKIRVAAGALRTSPRGTQRKDSTPPVSPGYLRLRIPTSDSPEAPAVPAIQEDGDGLFRRASTASIESHPRSELKSIEIVRRSSIGSARDSAPVTPVEPGRESVEEPVSAATQSPTSPLQYKGGIVFPSPPSVPPRASSLRASPESDKKAKKGELNPTIPKRKHGAGRRDFLSSPLKPGEDNFDRHVSEVLDRVHAPIRFRTRPGAETPQPLSSTSTRAPRLPKAGEKKNMTLAPAEISPKKATPADPEVKLYHLTQAGRAEPIKLYVRLVGEGERVMVRVGGGWADLADYLRQYAEHHGSRTVSEGTVDLQTANGNASAAKRTFSGPPTSAELKSLVQGQGKSPVTPELSAFPALERPRTRDSERSWLGKEQPEFSMGDSGDEESEASPGAGNASHIAPPRRSSLLSSSRPSTAQSVRPADDSPLGGPGRGLSLAGPSKLKADLPEQKARWVEGMIQQVNKSASAEKSREEKEKYVAEMGRVGGVRRVAFRSTSGAN